MILLISFNDRNVYCIQRIAHPLKTDEVKLVVGDRERARHSPSERTDVHHIFSYRRRTVRESWVLQQKQLMGNVLRWSVKELRKALTSYFNALPRH